MTRCCAVGLCCVLFLATPLSAQGPGKSDTITAKGVVKSTTVKGRSRSVTVTTTEGNEFDVAITPRVKFEVRAKGDAGFVRPGQLLQAQGVLTNSRLFTNDVEVILLPKGRTAPPGSMEKSARSSGASVNSYDVSGPILAAQQDTDYPDYLAVAVKTAGKPTLLMLGQNFKVAVVSDDIELVKEGMPMELEAVPGPGGRPLFVRLTVTLPDALKSEDVLGVPDANTR